jgi:hypothetical protein
MIPANRALKQLFGPFIAHIAGHFGELVSTFRPWCRPACDATTPERVITMAPF